MDVCSSPNGRVAHEERYLSELRERIRDVRQGPDGLRYLLTDSRMAVSCG
jgi:glucose/arabinose dehydrogenase